MAMKKSWLAKRWQMDGKSWSDSSKSRDTLADSLWLHHKRLTGGQRMFDKQLGVNFWIGCGRKFHDSIHLFQSKVQFASNSDTKVTLVCTVFQTSSQVDEWSVELWNNQQIGAIFGKLNAERSQIWIFKAFFDQKLKNGDGHGRVAGQFVATQAMIRFEKDRPPRAGDEMIKKFILLRTHRLTVLFDESQHPM